MSTVVEDLSSQITGIETVFVAENPLDEGVVVALNGIIIGTEDYTVTDTYNLTLSYAPAIGDALLIFVTPTVYDVSDQVTGNSRSFNADISDSSNLQFLAILNGIVYTTTKISDTRFDLGFTTSPGDELLYMRGYFIAEIRIDNSFSVTGTVKKIALDGEVS